ncbi:small hydrophobic protein [Streptomyces sp. NPDC059002]|uniref:small hydrophobic protein n=1 Tax=Streptomyces sp. NPDC059002 TaxID=3346690 RepID=UPI003682420B
MMAGFGHTTRKHPRSRGRTWSRMGSPLLERSRELGDGPDRATLGIVGVICAIAGFFVLGIILGPLAIVCGWLGMGRSWTGARPVPALVALVLGTIDTALALIWIAGATSTSGML